MKKRTLLLFCLSLFLLSGCLRFALRLTPSLFPNIATSLFEECDIQLAKDAIPANLVLMEGLLKNDPGNRQILQTLSQGFAGYSMLFVEDADPERASELYLRARDYGIRALGNRGANLKRPGLKIEDFRETLKALGKEDLEALFWTTISWSAWINLNLDKPAAIAQLNLTQACLERVMEIDADYFYGMPHILRGISLSARPPLLGGDVQTARESFEKALNVGHRSFLPAQYYFARYYAVRTQDKKLFLQLIQEIVDKDPQGMKEICLMNGAIQVKAKELRKMTDDFFI